jgi:alpha-tubulin suppressor-like RCC1 family protein
VDVSIGATHSLAVTDRGTLLTTGANDRGQLGLPNVTATRSWLETLSGLDPRPGRIAAGVGHSLAIKKDGVLWVTGLNENGQLGLGDTTTRPVWTPALKDVARVDAGSGFGLALTSDGSLWGAGIDGVGQLGLGAVASQVQRWMRTLADVVSMSCGQLSSYAIRRDGSLWACGENEHGELGTGDTEPRKSWTKVMDAAATGYQPRMVSGGFRHALFLRGDGTLWGTGWNAAGQLGLGDATTRTAWTRLPLHDVWGASAGHGHSLALVKSGGAGSGASFAVHAAGDNERGQLGLGAQGPGSTTWRKVEKRTGEPVAHGSDASFLLADDGLWVVGDNANGECGVTDPGPGEADPLLVIPGWRLSARRAGP